MANFKHYFTWPFTRRKFIFVFIALLLTYLSGYPAHPVLAKVLLWAMYIFCGLFFALRFIKKISND